MNTNRYKNPRNFRNNRSKNFRPKNYDLIDLNCDLGQNLGVLQYTNEESLLPFVSSVNIACGAHAGNEKSILNSLETAKSLGLSIGAHLGFKDLENFGREELKISKEELKRSVFTQLNLIFSLAKQAKVNIVHCRPHGAMYSKTLQEEDFAIDLAKSVSSFSRWLALVLPIGVNPEKISEKAGIKVITEAMIDRPYKKTGIAYKTLPVKPLASEFVFAQANSLIFSRQLIVEGGKRLRVNSLGTINLKLTREDSLELAQKVHKLLADNKRLSPIDSLSKIGNFEISDLLRAN